MILIVFREVVLVYIFNYDNNKQMPKLHCISRSAAWIMLEFLNINHLSVNKHNLLDCKINNGQNRYLIDQASDSKGM